MANPVMPTTLGVWFVGARGSIAAMTMLSARLLSRNAIEPIGLLTESKPYAKLPFCSIGAFRFGGCDLREEPLSTTLDAFLQDGIFPPHFQTEGRADLCEIEAAISCLPKSMGHASIDSLRDVPSSVVLEGIRRELAKFKDITAYPTIVVNVSSTERTSPLASQLASCSKWEELKSLIDNPDCQIPWGVLYASAALLENCAYINFTPNIGTELKALNDLSSRQKLPHAGKDGKTGETLLKTALAPMFEARALSVKSWTGYNLLGNSDGRTLMDPEARDAKIRSKDQQLRNILDETPDLCTKVGIDYVPSLGDWKTAWDFIHFEGILGIKMSLHLLWQGADTILAAPLVIDLIRLTELAWRRQEVGPLEYLGAFFKSPNYCPDQNFWVQLSALRKHLGIHPRTGE
jgi:myo-inositol-1-phosphate synthase